MMPIIWRSYKLHGRKFSGAEKEKSTMKQQKLGLMVRGAVLASLLIGLGDYVLLKLGAPLGQFLFSLGLMGVCVLGANLFTGKCGFWLEDKIPLKELMIILAVNLLSGYVIGLLFSSIDPSLTSVALVKVNSWTWGYSYLMQSVLCGVIMYLAVKMYKEGSIWGILLGVPLFLFCGFQHSIANVISMGIARTLNPVIALCVLGNFLGSVFTSWLNSKREV